VDREARLVSRLRRRDARAHPARTARAAKDAKHLAYIDHGLNGYFYARHVLRRWAELLVGRPSCPRNAADTRSGVGTRRPSTRSRCLTVDARSIECAARLADRLGRNPDGAPKCGGGSGECGEGDRPTAIWLAWCVTAQRTSTSRVPRTMRCWCVCTLRLLARARRGRPSLRDQARRRGRGSDWAGWRDVRMTISRTRLTSAVRLSTIRLTSKRGEARDGVASICGAAGVFLETCIRWVLCDRRGYSLGSIWEASLLRLPRFTQRDACGARGSCFGLESD